MQTTLLVIQIIVAIAMSALILIQAKGTGLGRAFGQGTYHSKRGVEFVVFRFTIVLSVIFVAISIVSQML